MATLLIHKTTLQWDPELPWQQGWDKRRFDQFWHRLVEVCRKLDREGWHYTVKYDAIGKKISIRGAKLPTPATGQVDKLTLPKVHNAPLTLDQCTKRRIEAEKIALVRAGDDDDEVAADVEYWRELERLARERKGIAA